MEPEAHNKTVEVWGGVECSVVRVNDRIHDQLEKTGFGKRPDDLKLFSDLGIRTLRYPLIWEKYEADPQMFLRLHDSMLRKAQIMGITPIAGLLHHGSGPAITNPYENDFPDLLAEYAFSISRRYPWLKFYTPVNEPLTTARFSGLYGFWYPHRRDIHSFHRIFINEMKGIVLSMKAIRSNNPRAELIQTEDLAKIHSTKLLTYQAEYENQRSWLTFDFLTGKFTPEHPLWEFFISSGIKEKELEFFQTNVIKPEVCGFNYYISSERYLDHNLNSYPAKLHGGNGRHRYADIEAVRISEIKVNPYELLKKAWERYHLSLALTEVHLGCTREEQLRWFTEIWNTANKIKNENIPFKAVTAWSLLGCYNWSSLMQYDDNNYESGAFDIRSGKPRPTALAAHIRNTISGDDSANNLLNTPGWWRRDIRIKYGSGKLTKDKPDFLNNTAPLIIFGMGSLGNAFAKVCHTRGLKHEVVFTDQLAVLTRQSLEDIILNRKPWSVINATGFADIDKAEQTPDECFRVNTLIPSMLAGICKTHAIKLVTFSSDQVFNGKKRNPYIESDQTGPLNVYGESKRKAEDTILKLYPETLIIRSSIMFDPWNPKDVLRQLLSHGHNKARKRYFPTDIIISPAYIADVVNSTLDLLIDNESGIWHLSNADEISFFRFITMAFDMAGISDKYITGLPYAKMKYRAQRPQYSVLCDSRGLSLARLSNALKNYLDELTLIAK